MIDLLLFDCDPIRRNVTYTLIRSDSYVVADECHPECYLLVFNLTDLYDLMYWLRWDVRSVTCDEAANERADNTPSAAHFDVGCSDFDNFVYE